MILEASTSIMLLISSLYMPTTFADASLQPVVNNPVKTAYATISNTTLTQNTKTDKPLTLKQYVLDYFKDDPILIEVASCESTFRQFNSSGKLLRGEVNSDDVGVMQINEKYHYERAMKMGLDIRTLEGNLAYAKWLYDNQGLKPWNSSSKCWTKSVATKIQNQILARN